MTPYERVRQSRELTAATFPLPSVLDCIRYAITELAEYDDALLRQERTGDKRNNDKAHDPRNELGQCGYMLLSAMMVANKPPQPYRPTAVQDPTALYPFVLRNLADCVIGAGPGTNAFGRLMPRMQVAYDAWCSLAASRGWYVDALIDDTCAAFEAKHAPAREVR